MNPEQQAIAAFQDRFGEIPTYVARAPGRVNLIGEHTDYNAGFVLPMAINRAIWIALAPRTDRQVLLYSLDFDEPTSFHLDDIDHGESWDEYIRGTAWAILKSGVSLQGWNGVLASDIPIGAGLSSSAALEMATAMAFSVVGGWTFEPIQIALLGQQAENEWVGAKTGIMDQLVSACGVAGKAICIDCRTMQIQPAPIPNDTGILVLDTNTRRGLVDSAYNDRRSQCEAAAQYFGVEVLRDIAMDAFEQRKEGLDRLKVQRARHVISENARVLQAVEAMKAGDRVQLGQLFNASHTSLRDDFEVSSLELDIMVEIAQKRDGCFGARMTGAGFGGCAVALVNLVDVENFITNVEQEYRKISGLKPAIYLCEAVDGANFRRVKGGETP